ncbi:MAG TPA: CAP domain-containing protein [Herpetosiphonaceae bacterium]
MTVRPRVQLSILALAAMMLILSVLFIAPAASASPDLNRVIVLTNEHRRAAGCGNLLWNPALGAAAQRHADDMAASNYFSHNSRNGRSFATRIRQAGYRYRLAAENIAAGQQSPEEVVATWMASPGHRANILNCRLRHIGIGFGANGGSAYGTYWVQDFGTAR